MPKNKAVFLDRDNTLIPNDGDLGDPARVELIKGAASAIASLNGLGYRTVVVTNQGGVARGKYGESDVEAVHRRINELVSQTSGVEIDRFYFCPYHPEGSVRRYRREHPWRKPQPGMLQQAAKDLDIDLSQSWMIGDQMRDMQAGLAAGTRCILLQAESDAPAEARDASKPIFFAENLVEAVRIVGQQRKPQEKAAMTKAASTKKAKGKSGGGAASGASGGSGGNGSASGDAAGAGGPKKAKARKRKKRKTTASASGATPPKTDEKPAEPKDAEQAEKATPKGQGAQAAKPDEKPAAQPKPDEKKADAQAADDSATKPDKPPAGAPTKPAATDAAGTPKTDVKDAAPAAAAQARPKPADDSPPTAASKASEPREQASATASNNDATTKASTDSAAKPDQAKPANSTAKPTPAPAKPSSPAAQPSRVTPASIAQAGQSLGAVSVGQGAAAGLFAVKARERTAAMSASAEHEVKAEVDDSDPSAPRADAADSPPAGRAPQITIPRPVQVPRPSRPPGGEPRPDATPGRRQPAASTQADPFALPDVEERPRAMRSAASPPPPSRPAPPQAEPTPTERLLRQVVQELRSQRATTAEFSYLQMLAIVLQMFAVVCVLGGLLMGAETSQFIRWISVAMIAQLATIAMLLFRR